MKKSDRDVLANKLTYREGTLDQAEEWLDQLKQADPNFYNSDAMLQLETIVHARREYEAMKLSLPEGLNREQITTLVSRLSKGEGSESEQQAWLMFLNDNVPHPHISDLIFHTVPDLTAEEIVEKALSYKPILLSH